MTERMKHKDLPLDACDMPNVASRRSLASASRKSSREVTTFGIAVIGGGPAGIMAAIRAGEFKRNVVLIERNDSLGKKLLMTGKGRCNLTNTAELDIFIEKFGRSGQFLRTAFFRFFNRELMDFFKANGLELKEERQGRVFPEDDKSVSVVRVLEKALEDVNVRVMRDSRLIEIKKEDGYFRLGFGAKGAVFSKKVVVATGGASYKATGSTGDGYHIAKTLGHTFAPLKPGLVPLKTKEPWIKDLQGLTLKNISVTFECEKKKICSDVGELLFTHFGVSGPLVLDLSNELSCLIWDKKPVYIFIDLKPGLTAEQLDGRILRDISAHGSINIKTMLKELLPIKLVPVFIALLKLDAGKRINQLGQTERRAIIDLLKSFKLTVSGTLPIEDAMVTLGGISTKEIDPRTMESRAVPGLYFAGEVIDAHAPSGGFNLQQAFSTGYLAGESAANPALSRKGGAGA